MSTSLNRTITSIIIMLTILSGMFAMTAHAIAQTLYALDSGDTLRITVFGEPDLSGDFTIDAQGRLNLALIGPVVVRGQTADQTRALIHDAYQDGYLRHPDVTVEVIAFRPFFIVGEVNQPGSYDYVPGMNVLNAIAIGGGMTYRGDEDDIEILRGNDTARVSIPANLATIVMPGDIVRVAERYF
ncbi:polysaccharide biosynthesis/export family protein [Thalassospira sp. CH_XMU1448-2]|uniref:polysaccharide biosynthesis/export family protein n=1 Tax=Thalassospira sp. CH_XMU1448-2 TaxID=3107773 RepID=UPI00300BDED3